MLEIFVAVLVILLFFIVTKALEWKKHRDHRKALLEMHNSRTRRIFGCIHCGSQLFPPGYLYRCGGCKEEHTVCLECWAKEDDKSKFHFDGKKADNEVHVFYKDKINLEIAFDTSKCKDVPRVIYETMHQFEERNLLGCLKGDDYQWLSYGDVYEKLSRLGSAMKTKYGLKKGDCVVLLAASCVDWYLCQFTCFLHGFVVIPPNHSISKEFYRHIVSKTNPKLVMISKHLLDYVEGEKESFVVIEDMEASYELRQELKKMKKSSSNNNNNNKDLLTFVEDLIEVGDHISSSSSLLVENKEDDLVLLLPTSGTTGKPKLVMITDSMLRLQVRTTKQGTEMILLSHQPFRQALDLLSKGASIGCWSGSYQTIMRDLRILRPTVFGSTPAWFQSLRSQYLADKDENKLEKWKAKMLLGNRCKSVIIGGSVCSADLKKFIFNVLGCNVNEGFGSTETGGLALNSSVQNEAMTLVDCKALGYTTADIPNPRGEIVAIRTKRTTPGYYNDEEATKECLVTLDNGKQYWRTGDIGERLPDGTVKIIDRIKSFFKLSNGCFVSPQRLETIYQQSKFVKQVFVTSDNANDSIVVVCNANEGSRDELLILKDFRSIAQANDLLPYEIPSKVYVDEMEWNESNGCLSSIGKLSRVVLKERFKQKIGLNSDAAPISIPLSMEGGDSISSGVVALMKECFGNVSLLSGSDTLMSLGANSISLARFANVIKERFGVSKSIRELSEMDLNDIQDVVFGSGASGEERAKMDFDKEISEGVKQFKDATESIKQAKTTPKDGDIILTGSTGFFGTFLLSGALERWPKKKVICLVRAKDDVHAQTRVDESLNFYDVALTEEQKKRIVSKAFDLSKDSVDIEAFGNISVVIHNASVVNSTMSYSAIKSSNVGGTIKMMILARASGALFHHVSTIGLLGFSGVAEETEKVSSENVRYLSGYAQSKYVSEQIVLKCLGKNNCGIYRLGTIGGHSKSGVCNVRDSIILMCKGLNKIAKVNLSCLPPFYPIVCVDVAARAVLDIVEKENAFGIYHIINTKSLASKDLLKSLDAVAVEKEDFLRSLEEVPTEHPLYFLKDTLKSQARMEEGQKEEKEIGNKDTNTVNVLGSDWCEPRCTSEMINQWIKWSMTKK